MGGFDSPSLQHAGGHSLGTLSTGLVVEAPEVVLVEASVVFSAMIHKTAAESSHGAGAAGVLLGVEGIWLAGLGCLALLASLVPRCG